MLWSKIIKKHFENIIKTQKKSSINGAAPPFLTEKTREL